MSQQDTREQRILIVEDEPKIARLVADYLEGSGFATHHLDHGDSVLAWLDQARHHEHMPALVLLDLMLPGTDGLTLCREIRQRWPHIAVVMLTARVEEVDRLLGLELGADDYICKPFSPREVVARVKAVLRRSLALSDPGAQSGSDLVLDDDGWRALADGQDLALTAVEFQLLKVMMHAPGRIFSRDQLMDHMYRDHRIVSERTVDSHVKKLRRKIGEVWPEREVIRSVYGVGYKYQPEE
ncbi:response regulator [Halomonas urumqiensis]|uniref:Two-component system response regulator BaeR n=1 Tax=Halomonas urumqiensis TaxID=1684789 RepID=A0A2N7UH97_9GAMM|nr:response regulator [Halomonas urumqiensis]PMR79837.1 two-component system response regulator BaeR [Halomonas urumqiensis]PTB02136.1 two-component system response regulator BaeR [Halomonas urumqiensis]GHE21588.1 DNA-binding response regulator [Halomonas urumqiensis]